MTHVKNDHEILQMLLVLVIPVRTEYFGIVRESCNNSTTPYLFKF